jgi:hypothetical protein
LPTQIIEICEIEVINIKEIAVVFKFVEFQLFFHLLNPVIADYPLAFTAAIPLRIDLPIVAAVMILGNFC